jgi:hypothetical protein
MTAALFLLSVLCVVLLALLIWQIRETHAARAAASLEQIRMHNWVHNSVRGIRGRVSYFSPEATAVCNAIEKAFPGRNRPDLDALEKALASMRREHGSEIILNSPVIRLGERLRDMLATIATAAGALGAKGIEAQALSAIALLKFGRKADELFLGVDLAKGDDHAVASVQQKGGV